MGLRFTALASGSAGNSALVECDGFGVLIDAGLGPRQLASRLAAVGAGWASIHAVLLTHVHCDHWKDSTFAHLRRRGVPLHCHREHHAALLALAPAFSGLLSDGLVRSFEEWTEFALAPGLCCRPLPVRHDGGATFGFRLTGPADLFGEAAALGYVADLGVWDDALADALADVELLAVEFNHDVAMQYASGRPRMLIDRVLGDDGHLSNAQAAELVRAVMERSAAGRLRHVVQLHLSRECNRPGLARAALKKAAAGLEVCTAQQNAAGATLYLAEEGRRLKQRAAAGAKRRLRALHPLLPGMRGPER